MEICEDNTKIKCENITVTDHFNFNDALTHTENTTPNNNGEQKNYELTKEYHTDEMEIISRSPTENIEKISRESNSDHINSNSNDQTCFSDVDNNSDSRKANGRACKKIKLDSYIQDEEPVKDTEEISNLYESLQKTDVCDSVETKNPQTRSNIRAFKKIKCENDLETTEINRNSVECDSTNNNVEEQLGSLTTYNNVEGSELKANKFGPVLEYSRK